MQRGEKAAEMPLPAKELRREIADVRDFNVLRLQGNSIECRLHGIPECVEDLDAISRPVLRKVGLISPQYVYAF